MNESLFKDTMTPSFETDGIDPNHQHHRAQEEEKKEEETKHASNKKPLSAMRSNQRTIVTLHHHSRYSRNDDASTGTIATANTSSSSTTDTITATCTSPSNETPLLSPFFISSSASQKSLIQNDIEEENLGVQIIATVDMLEDELDYNAYELLIPLNIRMKLENRLFGWTDIYTEFLCHLLFPLSYYMVTFIIVSILGLKINPSNNNNMDNEMCDIGCRWNCNIRKYSFNRWTQDHESQCNYVAILDMSTGLFLSLRQILSLWAAFNAFRTVRRRRKVWLRSTAAEYFKDEKRQEEIMEVDKHTLLGKIRRKLRTRRIHKSIKKASKRFEKRQTIRSKVSTKIESQRSIDASDDSDGYGIVDTYSSDSDGNSASTNSELFLEPECTPQQPDPYKFMENYEKYQNSCIDDDPKESHGSPGRFYAHTMPTSAIQSIRMDQICLKSKIENVPYAHGGFFGAAPYILANPHWIDILRQLMPDVYVEISRRVVNTPAPKLIHWAENNPVVAAYGTAHEIEFSGRVPTLEWDVFLDPHLVQRVQVVLEAKDSWLNELAESSEQIHRILNHGINDSCSEKMKAICASLRSDSTEESASHRKILDFYNSEVEKRAEVLLGNMMIAHGSMSQLALEQTGIMKHFNFSRVKHTRRTLGGGVFAKHWIPTFVQALKMSTKSSSQRNGGDKLPSSEHDNKEKIPLLKSEVSTFQELGLSSIAPTTIAESIHELKQITECDAPLGLMLDVKSRNVPKRVWALVLDALRKAGARVEGIGSFYVEDIRDISLYTSVPVNEIIFFHSAGDLQHACHDGIIKKGDCVFFNAGSLFWNHPVHDFKDVLNTLYTCLSSFNVEDVKKNYKLQPYTNVPRSEESQGDITLPLQSDSSTIQQYKERFDLSIGMYIQEFIVDDRILEILIEHVNDNKHVYDLGLSWGGINGLTVRGIQPGRLTSTDGLWNQRYLGKSWDIDKYPNKIPISS